MRSKELRSADSVARCGKKVIRVKPIFRLDWRANGQAEVADGPPSTRPSRWCAALRAPVLYGPLKLQDAAAGALFLGALKFGKKPARPTARILRAVLRKSRRIRLNSAPDNMRSMPLEVRVLRLERCPCPASHSATPRASRQCLQVHRRPACGTVSSLPRNPQPQGPPAPPQAAHARQRLAALALRLAAQIVAIPRHALAQAPAARPGASFSPQPQ